MLLAIVMIVSLDTSVNGEIVLSKDDVVPFLAGVGEFFHVIHYLLYSLYCIHIIRMITIQDGVIILFGLICSLCCCVHCTFQRIDHDGLFVCRNDEGFYCEISVCGEEKQEEEEEEQGQ